jgi:3-deoxy-7-phosphoheptulonate synthase
MLIAGPCTLKNYEQGLRDAQECKRLGIKYFRAGVFKPRTSPYDFQGLREGGMMVLQQIKQATGVKVVTELVDAKFLPLYDFVDIIQIGSRNCQNFELLKAVGKAEKTVLLKRGFGMTIQEFICAADYLIHYGADEVILCERGIRTFENETRNTLDLAAVPIIHQKTKYKIIVDPSHGTGRRDLVLPMSSAAMAVGADGLLIEMTQNPDKAPTDGFQTIDYEQGAQLKKIYDFYKSGI